MNYALPMMPSSTLDLVPTKLNLYLSDAAGPYSARIPLTPWRMVVAKDAEHALMQKTPLITGTSDAEGKILLDDSQNTTVFDTYKRHPGQVWLVYGAHARSLNITAHNPDWTDQHQRYHAQDAMGYFDNLDHAGTKPMLDDGSTTHTQDKLGADMLNSLKA